MEQYALIHIGCWTNTCGWILYWSWGQTRFSIMADGGLYHQGYVNIDLNIPLYWMDKQQEIQSGRRIASLQIHVEPAVGRIKYTVSLRKPFHSLWHVYQIRSFCLCLPASTNPTAYRYWQNEHWIVLQSTLRLWFWCYRFLHWLSVCYFHFESCSPLVVVDQNNVHNPAICYAYFDHAVHYNIANILLINFWEEVQCNEGD